MVTQSQVTTHRVRIRPRLAEWDPRGRHLAASARRFGYREVEEVTASRLYFVEGELSSSRLEGLCQALLLEPVSQVAEYGQGQAAPNLVEVCFHPGVTDTEADNLVAAAHRLGYPEVIRAATGWSYLIEGHLGPERTQELATRVLSNPVVQSVSVGGPIPSPLQELNPVRPRVEAVPLTDLAEEQLTALSGRLQLALDLEEMKSVQAFYRTEQREPTLAELQTLAQTWSEHCVHKTFRAAIHYQDEQGEQQVDGLLKTYLKRATDELNRDWVVSAFVDNAGLVRFTDQLDLAIKAETHNHPSALEPFGGANTGVGGVVRDVLGVSARPIANTDVLCFAPPETANLPAGTLHPETILEGVVRGIADYGNKMGIPTVAGAVVFHPDYVANPLVYCGCLGILPRGGHPTEARPGDRVVVVGGRTGRDGLGGATFSSMEMDVTTSEKCSTAVQIGNPIEEKLVAEGLLEARDRHLYHAVTDCGAGGLSSAVGEMGERLGARVELDRVLTKYPGLLPWEVWLSEAQERMVLAVADEHWDELCRVFADRGVEATTIGRFEKTGRLRLVWGELEVADLPMEFLHNGIPQSQREAQWTAPPTPPEQLPQLEPLRAVERLLADSNLSSRQPVVDYYDYEVQGGTARKPGQTADGAVIVPSELQGLGDPPAAVVGVGICPHRTELDPRLMAWMAIDEAVRNAVVVGADPDQIAILDNFCWGNPRLPDRLGSLVRCCQGCYEAALAYGTPYVSGKDSLNNEYLTKDGQRRAIPGTLMITALGQVRAVSKTVGGKLQKAGSLLVMVGADHQELGGSALTRVAGGSSARLPQPRPEAVETYRAYHRAVGDGVVLSAHDIGEGGLAVAAAEMALGSGLGVELHEASLETLFSETMGRLLLEVESDQVLERFPAAEVVGTVVKETHFQIGADQVPVAHLERAFEKHPFSCLEDEKPAQPELKTRLSPGPVPKTAPRVAVLMAPGTNRERDAVLALEAAGAQVEMVRMNRLQRLEDFGLVVLPGGFSYGDDLGAGRLWAFDLQARVGDQLAELAERDRLLLGICNGFQALVQADLVPGQGDRVTLAPNRSGHFECRWVELLPESQSVCWFTQGLEDAVECPMAHGEGRFLTDEDLLQTLERRGQVALRYRRNPNGSVGDIAGLCNRKGNVLGLMPHPEDNVFFWHHPKRGAASGLAFLRNGLNRL